MLPLYRPRCSGVLLVQQQQKQQKLLEVLEQPQGTSGSGNSSSTSVSTKESGDADLDGLDLHILTVLSGVAKLGLQRDIEEASHTMSLQSVSKGQRGQKRKEPCSSGEEDDTTAFGEVRRPIRVVLERRKLVPSSQVRKYREWMQKNKEPGKAAMWWKKVRWGLKERLEKMGGRQKRGYLRPPGDF